MFMGKLLKKAPKSAESGKFSDFFRHASEEKKREVFIEVARRANKDQREVFRKAQLKIETST